MTSNKINDYLKIKEAASFVGVSAGTLRNWEGDGKLKAYRNPKNGYRLYKVEDLNNLLGSVAESYGSRNSEESNPCDQCKDNHIM
jgi:MerR family transcriptional regulator, copper efflux regulator